MTLPQVPFDDRGLAYGDGVFETVLLRQGKPVLWPYHLARLTRGCRRLGIPVPGQQALDAAWQEKPQAPLEVLKLIVTRGSGGRGYALPDAPLPRLLIRRTPFVPAVKRWQEGVTVRQCRLQLGHQPLLAGIKHLNRLENVLARREWHSSEIAEGLLGDTHDQLVEATSMNVFWQQQGHIYTPRLDKCGVAGTLRDALIEKGEVHEATLPMTALPTLERLWVANSVQGVWPVTALVDQANARLKSWSLEAVDDFQLAAHRLLGYVAQ
ncbi:aminodeoxychorismate lyase [Halomonas aquamarina]|uniref:Aminodeoxychorismate lyase n=1 Tax=Vreelandella aquamarina TaxID=77097 RepID=A0ACC5VS31_9GAMM|nr:aminodeoxychorismate lyase [Halomonas aquamarina]MBZ5486719.1 aminodeoxychorismate lyase [Halomonas aquamarina]